SGKSFRRDADDRVRHSSDLEPRAERVLSSAVARLPEIIAEDSDWEARRRQVLRRQIKAANNRTSIEKIEIRRTHDTDRLFFHVFAGADRDPAVVERRGGVERRRS